MFIEYPSFAIESYGTVAVTGSLAALSPPLELRAATVIFTWPGGRSLNVTSLASCQSMILPETCPQIDAEGRRLGNHKRIGVNLWNLRTIPFGLPEKIPGNSDHPALFRSGRPDNFVALSALRCKGTEHQGNGVAGEGRTGVIATGVIRKCRQLSENGGEVSSGKSHFVRAASKFSIF